MDGKLYHSNFRLYLDRIGYVKKEGRKVGRKEGWSVGREGDR